MSLVQGDTVQHEGAEWVVVVVEPLPDPEADRAILRRPVDLEGNLLVAVPVDELEATGHVSEVPGWTEVEHGEWRRDDGHDH